MKLVIKSLVLTGAIAIVLAPMPARADGWVAPWIGSSFGSGLNTTDNSRGTFGVSAGGMGAGIVGGEVDFGFTPSFFGDNTQFGNNSVLNLTGNVIVGIPIGGTYGKGVRPYVLGGGGLIRTSIDRFNGIGNPTPASNLFGWDVGAGVMGYFNEHIGLRGELRYLRATHDMNGDAGINTIDLQGNKLHFWRPSIGVVFR
jgi:outer membrane protein with beta-barrel domain